MHKWVFGTPRDEWRAEVTYDYGTNKNVFRIWKGRDVFGEWSLDYAKAVTEGKCPEYLWKYFEALQQF
jgi:hypothetical protein